jgi:spore maturation protein CgeB
LYLDIIQLEDEIWEKFYKKDNFNSMSNSITFSENMLNLLVNKDFSKLIKKIESTDYKNNNIINSIKNKSNSFELTNQEINEIIKPFKKIYFNF